MQAFVDGKLCGPVLICLDKIAVVATPVSVKKMWYF